MSSNTEAGEDRPHRIRRAFAWLFGLVGIRRAAVEGQWVLLTRRFPFCVLGAFVVFAAGSAWFVHYSSTPEFCASCHYIRPYVDSWRTSSHNMVTCAKCHFGPGIKGFVETKLNGLTELIKTITATHGPRPVAEVDDASCLRSGCHDTRLLNGVVMFKEKYRFDHVPHLTQLRRGKQLRCTSCHSQIVQGAHISVTESVCFTCHFKGHVQAREAEPVGGCTGCHDAPKEAITLANGDEFQHSTFLSRGVPCWKCHSDSVQGTGDVPKQVCAECHLETQKLERYTDSKFMHDWHVTKHKVECFQCHSEIRHSLHPEPYSDQSSCNACHAPSHSAHQDMFAGKGGEGVDDHPSMHFVANVDCVACHQERPGTPEQHALGMTSYETTEDACVACHGDSIKGTLETWRSVIGDSVKDAGGELKKAVDAVGAMPEDSADLAKAKALLEEAQHNFGFVEKSNPAHNPDYALELLDKISSDVSSVLGLAK